MIDVKVTGIQEIGAKLSKLPAALQDAAAQSAAEYMLKILKNDAVPGYRYVSRARAYPNAPAGPGWFSERQRRYVMAQIYRGGIKIPYSRTRAMVNAWRIVGKGKDTVLVNDSQPAPYAYGDTTQANQLRMAGWMKISEIAKKWGGAGTPSLPRALYNWINAAIGMAIKRLGL